MMLSRRQIGVCRVAVRGLVDKVLDMNSEAVRLDALSPPDMIQ